MASDWSLPALARLGTVTGEDTSTLCFGGVVAPLYCKALQGELHVECRAGPCQEHVLSGAAECSWKELTFVASSLGDFYGKSRYVKAICSTQVEGLVDHLWPSQVIACSRHHACRKNPPAAAPNTAGTESCKLVVCHCTGANVFQDLTALRLVELL